MKTGLRSALDRIDQKKKEKEMLEEMQEQMMKVMFEKQIKDASKKR